MRFAIVVRANSATRGEKASPWRLVGLLLDAFGWKLEGIHELKKKALPAVPEKPPEEIAAERQAAIVALITDLRGEREAFRQALGFFDSLEERMAAELSQLSAKTVGLDPLPQNVFAIGPCPSPGGRHAFVKVRSEEKGGPLRCSRCERLAWFESGHSATKDEKPAGEPDPTGEIN